MSCLPGCPEKATSKLGRHALPVVDILVLTFSMDTSRIEFEVGTFHVDELYFNHEKSL